jgi:hypothetical protein
MPRSRPVTINESAKGLALARMTAAAKTNSPTTSDRRIRVGRPPIRAAGPTSSGSVASALDTFHR